MVIYTGSETKLALNEGKYLSKISNFTYQLNVFLLVNICVMLTMAILMSAIGTRSWIKNNMDSHFYIFSDQEPIVDIDEYSVKAFMSFYLLFSNLLPLDMAITIIIGKLIATWLVRNDVQMFDFERSCIEKELIGCDVKNLSMLEDFAQINHLFCDKTGTLTKNELIFKAMIVGTHTFTASNEDRNFK
jgi:magnesium-transporting ATPase (P-type)